MYAKKLFLIKPYKHCPVILQVKYKNNDHWDENCYKIELFQNGDYIKQFSLFAAFKTKECDIGMREIKLFFSLA